MMIDQTDHSDVLKDYSRMTAIDSAYAMSVAFKARCKELETNLVAPDRTRKLHADDLDPLEVSSEAESAMKALSRGQTRYLAIMRSTDPKEDPVQVLVEQKNISEPRDSMRSVVHARMLKLVDLLHFSPKPSSYRVLDCKAYAVQRYGSTAEWKLAFETPQALRGKGDIEVETLYSLLRKDNQSPTPKGCSLDARFRLAAKIANSILHLHAAGWLHRNLCSDNIVCLRLASENVDALRVFTTLTFQASTSLEWTRCKNAPKFLKAADFDICIQIMERIPRSSTRRPSSTIVLV